MADQESNGLIISIMEEVEVVLCIKMEWLVMEDLGEGGSSYAAAGHCSIGGTPGRGSDKGGNVTIQSSSVDGYGGGGGGGSQFYPGYGSGKGGKGGSGIVVILCQNDNLQTFQMKHKTKIGRLILFELLSLLS